MADFTLHHWEPNTNSGKPLMARLRKIYERPSAREAWGHCKVFTADRLTHLARSQAA